VARRRAAAQTKGQRTRAKNGPRALRAATTKGGGTGPSTSPSAAGSDGEPQALVVTHWFDSGEEGEPYSATVRLTGRRVGSPGVLKADTFTHEETVDDIVPGSGPVSVTSTVHGLQAGEWTVKAEIMRPPDHTGVTRSAGGWRRVGTEQLSRAAWSWRRWGLSDGPELPVKTRWALLSPFAMIPAVLPGSFTALGILAGIVALIIQSALLSGESIPVSGSLTASLLALFFGLLGAKLWSRVLHPGERLIGPGWAVDGFLVAAPIAAIATLAVLDLPIGPFLDATTPGLFFAVAIGRLGCFLTGCCAGRCTRSRWGIWSSDRRIGARRIPTQLLESATGLLFGVVSAALVLGQVIPVHGGVFIVALGSYFVVRQSLLRLRAESRRYLWQRRSPLVPGGA
jgi:phosphatidylglycerol:prolipoprotein diacylglycerol transferase